MMDEIQKIPFQTSTVAITAKEVLAVDDPVHSLKKRSNYIVFRYFYRFFLTHKVCYEHNAKVAEATGLAIPTIVLAKRFLADHSLLEVKVCDTWQKGKISYVYPTNQGWVKHHQIEAFFEKSKERTTDNPKKTKKFAYTETDMETAKLWLATIRKWWRGYPQKQAILPDWDKEKEERADGIRKARESVRLTDEEFQAIIKEVVHFPEKQLEFYVINVVGASKWTGKKWKNGKTPVECLMDTYYSHKRYCEKRSEAVLTQENCPEFSGRYTIDMNVERYGDRELQERVKTENAYKAWDALWNCLGDRLRVNFKTKNDLEKYKKVLSNICQAVGDFSYGLGYNFRAVQFRNQEIIREWEEERENKESKAFFYYMKDKHLFDGSWLFDERVFREDFVEFLVRINSCCPCGAGQDQFEDDIRCLKKWGIDYGCDEQKKADVPEHE